MNFGQNLYNWFYQRPVPCAALAIVVVDCTSQFKREFSKLIGFLKQFPS